MMLGMSDVGVVGMWGHIENTALRGASQYDVSGISVEMMWGPIRSKDLIVGCGEDVRTTSLRDLTS